MSLYPTVFFVNQPAFGAARVTTAQTSGGAGSVDRTEISGAGRRSSPLEGGTREKPGLRCRSVDGRGLASSGCSRVEWRGGRRVGNCKRSISFHSLTAQSTTTTAMRFFSGRDQAKTELNGTSRTISSRGGCITGVNRPDRAHRKFSPPIWAPGFYPPFLPRTAQNLQKRGRQGGLISSPAEPRKKELGSGGGSRPQALGIGPYQIGRGGICDGPPAVSLATLKQLMVLRKNIAD